MKKSALFVCASLVLVLSARTNDNGEVPKPPEGWEHRTIHVSTTWVYDSISKYYPSPLSTVEVWPGVRVRVLHRNAMHDNDTSKIRDNYFEFALDNPNQRHIEVFASSDPHTLGTKLGAEPVSIPYQVGSSRKESGQWGEENSLHAGYFRVIGSTVLGDTMVCRVIASGDSEAGGMIVSCLPQNQYAR